jgi:hypothetical protein
VTAGPNRETGSNFVKLETVMSLGYVKGRYWVSDEVFATYAKRPSYTAFLEALRKAGVAIQCSYSYLARTYHAEIVTYERLQNSANSYMLKHNNAYDRNPLAAMGRAAVESDYATPLVRACVLEMEVELLADAYRDAVERERRQAAAEIKINEALDYLRATLDRIPVTFMQGSEVISTARVGELRSKPFPPSALVKIVTYDEDDDL